MGGPWMRPGRLSIAYVHYGGQSGVTAAISRALLERGHDVRLVPATGVLQLRDPATRRPRPTATAALGVAIAAARFGRRALAHRWNTGYAFDAHSAAAGAALRALRPAPDLVLQNGALFAPGLPPPYPYALLCDHTRALAQATPGWPALGVAPPLDYGGGWFARERALYRGATSVACFSENVARSMIRDYGVDPGRVEVVGAGANVFPEQAPRRDDGRTIVFVGKEFARKGGHVLLDAFARVRRSVPKARLVIAGPPVPRSASTGVAWLGFVPLEELPALLAQASVFALPTLAEPFGIAFLDAMACGVPCVATRIEAVPEIVRDRVTGLLVPPGDPAALAEALLCLLGDPAAARAMGARGRAWVSAGALWSHVAARLERVLERGRAPRGRAA
ncbi:MAG TPA: glycosyltransferase family 4 protein [Anaeromyxobacter sp.]|nr:glycosyltransferase family 4 protein [Anaeromyxobacter sp.]